MSLFLNGVMAFQMLCGAGQLQPSLQPSLNTKLNIKMVASSSAYTMKTDDCWRLSCQTEKHKRNTMFEDKKVVKWVVPAIITIGAGSAIYVVYSVRGR